MYSPQEPWWVRENMSPDDVRKMREESPPQPAFNVEKWLEDYTQRKERGPIGVPRRANTTIPCPQCGKHLRKFFITSDPDAVARAEQSSHINAVVSGYGCVFPCNTVFFQQDLRGRVPAQQSLESVT